MPHWHAARVRLLLSANQDRPVGTGKPVASIASRPNIKMVLTVYLIASGRQLI